MSFYRTGDGTPFIVLGLSRLCNTFFSKLMGCCRRLRISFSFSVEAFLVGSDEEEL